MLMDKDQFVNRKKIRVSLFLVIMACFPRLCSAHDLGRIIAISYLAVIIVGSLMSGFAKVSILDRLGDPARYYGKLIAVVISIELLLFTLACLALAWTTMLPGSIFTITLIACAVEISLGMIVNWLFLARSAKPSLVVWLSLMLSITTPLALILASLFVAPIALEVIG
jgi:hypothetical protein